MKETWLALLAVMCWAFACRNSDCPGPGCPKELPERVHAIGQDSGPKPRDAQPSAEQEPAPARWFKLEISLSTTSDWTAARFVNGARVYVDEQRVEKSGSVQVSTGRLSLHKPSLDSTQVTLRAVVYVQLGGEKDLRLVVTRGYMGATRVRVGASGAVLLDALHDKPTGDAATNPREFTIPAADVRRGGAANFRPQRKFPRLVLAAYYPWYGRPDGPSKRWDHWDPSAKNHATTDTPSLGYYDSNDEQVILKHVRWAKSAGIDGFVASWWGRDTSVDNATRKLLQVAEKEQFVVCVYVELAERIRESIAYIRDDLAKSPAYLKVDGKPVIFIYSRAMSGKPSWFERIRQGATLIMHTLTDVEYGKAGGGMHMYDEVLEDLEVLRQRYEDAAFLCRQNNLIFVASVCPGFDDSTVRKPSQRRDREGGKFYDRFWSTATGAFPDWILIVSWNEWHEGSEIEPSVEHGDTYLTKTAEWIRRWKK